MNKLSVLIIAVLLLPTVLLANNETINTSNVTYNPNLNESLKENKVDFKQSLEKIGAISAVPETLRSETPAQQLSPEETNIIREKIKQQIHDNKFKKKPDFQFLPTKSQPPTQKKSHNRLQNEMDQLPNNIRFVAEFEEVQAVLVSIPSEPFFIAEVNGEYTYVPGLSVFDLNPYVKYYANDYGIALPPGFAVKECPPGAVYF